MRDFIQNEFDKWFESFLQDAKMLVSILDLYRLMEYKMEPDIMPIHNAKLVNYSSIVRLIWDEDETNFRATSNSK